MNIEQAFPSKYLKADTDIPESGDLIVTIDSVASETMGQGEKASTKPIVYFREVDKGLVLNKTNATTIAKLHGPETDNWPGKMVALFATEVDFQGKQTLAIRVRLKAPKLAGNGAADPRAAWLEWCGENSVTESDIRQALTTSKVSEWLAANKDHGATLDDAKALILASKEPF